MKYRINSLEDVAENLRSLYVADGDTFVLKLDDDPADGMRKARDHEKEARKEAERKLRELEKAKEDESDNRNKQKGDVDALEKSWQAKYDKREQELLGQVNNLKAHVHQTSIDGVANSLASELFTSPALVLPHIKSRLTVEEVDGKFETKILGQDGKPSAFTLDEYKKELIENKDFSAVLKVTKAKGGTGFVPNINNQGAHQNQETPNLAKASPADIVAHIRAKESN